MSSAPYSPGPVEPWGHTLAMGLSVVEHLAGLLAGESDTEDPWGELRQRAAAFGSYRRGEWVLRSATSFAAALEQALALDPYTALWTLEGIGHGLGSRAVGGGPDLAQEQRAQVPRQLLIPLNAGLGLALAARVLEGADGQRPDRALARFADLCRGHAWPGWHGVAFEGLGLAVRTLHPAWCEAIGKACESLGPTYAARFWHGVGRGLYFAPSRLIPVARGRWLALEEALSLPTSWSNRRRAVAGLAWALTLVNIGRPGLPMARWWRHPALRLEGDPIASGTMAALLVWHQTHGIDLTLARFLRDEDPRARPEARCSWHRSVIRPLAGILASHLEVAAVDRLFWDATRPVEWLGGATSRPAWRQGRAAASRSQVAHAVDSMLSRAVYSGPRLLTRPAELGRWASESLGCLAGSAAAPGERPKTGERPETGERPGTGERGEQP